MKPSITRSSKTAIQFANTGKLYQINALVKEYRRFMLLVVDHFWPKRFERLYGFVPNDTLKSFDSWLSARMRQAAGKQAIAIIKGTLAKNKKRTFKLAQFEKAGNFQKARKLRAIIARNPESKPSTVGESLELDSRFVTLEYDKSKTSFDAWLSLGSVGNSIQVELPLKLTKHFRSMLASGMELSPGCRLSSKDVSFSFSRIKPELQVSSNVLGIDIGQTTAFSCSNGNFSKPDIHGHTLQTIQETLSRKQKGSKGFKRTQDHRSNYIGWAIKRLGIEQFDQVNIENIKNLRRGKRSSRLLSHWTYGEIFDRLERYCEDHDVRVLTVNPIYTSQRCSRCGGTRKSNRKGKQFKCGQCGNALDADLNASCNIALNLPGITARMRRSRANRSGFYWVCEGQERIVPDVRRA